jgi:hypothetical protein
VRKITIPFATLKPVSPLNRAESEKNLTFSTLQGLNLFTSHILVFGCLRGQDVVGSFGPIYLSVSSFSAHLYTIFKFSRALTLC